MANFADLFKKTLVTGAGLVLKGKDEIKALLKKYEHKLSPQNEDSCKFLANFKGRLDKTQDELENQVEQVVKKFIKKADLATGEELNALKKELRELKEDSGDTSD